MDNQSLVWKWKTPPTDFRGYLAEFYLLKNNQQLTHRGIAVDVSSNWRRYPRYGFLSKYPVMLATEQEQIINKLSRFHINGLQFYDWQWKHHRPLCGSVNSPAYNWDDIAMRKNYRNTIIRYIALSHEKNIMAMAYNLIYGAYEDASNDGVQEQWRLFQDTAHQSPDKHDLPENWASDIYLINPQNSSWQNYLISEMGKVFEAFNFDGWHIDQLGNRGNRYDYYGSNVNLEESFHPFIEKIKTDLNKPLVFNAVDQYAQSQIASAPVDFLYTEVWSGTSYGSLASVITENDFYSSNQLSSILAAYINKGISSSPGLVNTAAVLLADAVIFANGGAHLELGEHYLSNEYFPNDNLSMTPELNERLIAYYDFLVAYENLLRNPKDSAPFAMITQANIQLSKTAKKDHIWVFNKVIDHYQIYHFINFIGVSSMDWRDPNGTQTAPEIITQLPIILKTDTSVENVWLASPDTNCYAPMKIPFSQQNDSLSLTIPYLEYWTMLVLEFKSPENEIKSSAKSKPSFFTLGQNYPNPFNATTSIPITINKSGIYTLKIINLAGQEVYTASADYETGYQEIVLHTDRLSSGIYFYTISENTISQFRKMLVIK